MVKRSESILLCYGYMLYDNQTVENSFKSDEREKKLTCIQLKRVIDVDNVAEHGYFNESCFYAIRRLW